MDKNIAGKIYNILESTIINPATELHFSSNFELLVAVILSAQCTDKRVNIVTDKLFKLFNKPEDFAELNQEDLEKLIFSTGFYKNKAKNIIAASRKIMSDFNGQVPGTFDELISLPGVGRKTANVMLSVGFNIPAIAVDTHVFRVSNRIGLANAKNVNQTEIQLQNLFNEKYYAKLHHLLILHGRYTCKARVPNCVECPLKKYCKYYSEHVAITQK